MFLLPANAFAALSPPTSSEFSRDRLRVRLDEVMLHRVEALTTLKHARYASLATALGEIVLRRLEPRSRGAAKAVVTVGNGLHFGIARAFSDRLHSAGSRLVNPIMFPNTLPSSSAVTIGALYGAHVCSVSVDGCGPVRRALHLSRLLLEAGSADEVLLLAFDLPIETEALALGYLISLSPLGYPSLEVTRLNDPSSTAEGAAQDGPGAWLAERMALEVAAGEGQHRGAPLGRHVDLAGVRFRLVGSGGVGRASSAVAGQ